MTIAVRWELNLLSVKLFITISPKQKKYLTADNKDAILVYVSHKYTNAKIISLGDIATIRTGVVTTRKKAAPDTPNARKYHLLNLHCIKDDGTLDLASVEPFYASEELSNDFITRTGDILVRLSAPYTSTIIDSRSEGLLIPSHFAIIRLKHQSIDPYYVLWQLRQKSSMQQIYQNVSGSTQFGTINSGLFNQMKIELVSLKQQAIFSELFKLTELERVLLEQLSIEKKKLNQALLAKAFKILK